MNFITTKWQLTEYDVWGNARDGYEINQAFHGNEIQLRLRIDNDRCAYPTIAQLRRECGIVKGVHLEIDQNYSDDVRVHLVRKSDQYPICELHCVSHSSLSPIRANE